MALMRIIKSHYFRTHSSSLYLLVIYYVIRITIFFKNLYSIGVLISKFNLFVIISKFKSRLSHYGYTVITSQN